MLSEYIRLINSNNSVLTDYSLDNQDTGTNLAFNMVAAEDYWYFAQRRPFNSFFMQVDTANATPSNLSIEYWEDASTEWRSALDVIDGTTSGGATLAKSGVVQFSTDSRYDWDISGDTYEDTYPTTLAALNITNVYWIRIKVSADLDAGTLIERIVYAFTSTKNINSHDPKITNFYNSFESGKTDWNDEIISASYQVARDLKKKQIILNRGQVLELEDISIPTDYKTLENIYFSLGGDYLDKSDKMKEKYDEAISLRWITKDNSSLGRVSRMELNQKVEKEITR